ncbi:hypothetical protein GS457_20145 [Rhodococcus hoagii]|nr:hypothetical protein [Prescottella equi]MBM4529609.1 hypothetical protein [Prescottella equi]MBM4546999.1 hypothetical protein [Prescottella equi]MBM4573820.1 hypothetical protein [Prescottella equi]MBM4604831.1 hypothetical protein [Prescottella equi]
MWTTPSWSELGAMADSGELFLEVGVAEKCAARCAELNRELVTLQRDAKRLARVDGLGHLPSGVALSRKFEQKASGGEYPLDQALAEHITVVEEMQSVFEKIAANYAAAEESNAQRFTEIGG